MALSSRRFAWPLLIVLVFLLLATAISLAAGYEPVTFERLQHSPSTRAIFLRLRLPRVVMAGLIGATLAVVGASLQALFRNPLAEPITLGVSGGGALGASIAIALGWGGRFGNTPLIFLAAFAGALASIVVVYQIAHSGFSIAPGSLLLAGVVMNLVTNAGVLTLQYTIDQAKSLEILRWLIGTLDVVGFDIIWRMLPVLLLGCAALLLLARDLHLLSIDPDTAASLGVSVELTERSVYLLASLLVGVTVAVGGSIGFVGLIVPHMARLLFGHDLRIAMPCSLFMGAGFLMLADAIARTALGQTELPVGAVTGLMGGPFFLWLMRRQLRYVA